MPVCKAPRTFEPMALKVYIDDARANAQNECERMACDVALRALIRKHPWLVPREDLTQFLF